MNILLCTEYSIILFDKWCDDIPDELLKDNYLIKSILNLDLLTYKDRSLIWRRKNKDWLLLVLFLKNPDLIIADEPTSCFRQ